MVGLHRGLGERVLEARPPLSPSPTIPPSKDSASGLIRYAVADSLTCRDRLLRRTVRPCPASTTQVRLLALRVRDQPGLRMRRFAERNASCFGIPFPPFRRSPGIIPPASPLVVVLPTLPPPPLRWRHSRPGRLGLNRNGVASPHPLFRFARSRFTPCRATRQCAASGGTPFIRLAFRSASPCPHSLRRLRSFRTAKGESISGAHSSRCASRHSALGRKA